MTARVARTGDAPPVDEEHPPLVRARRDLRWAVAAATVLLLTALAADASSVSGAEDGTFRLLNRLPELPFAPVWLLMQAGNVAAVAVAAAGALAARRPRLAAGLATASVLAYVGAKLVKQVVNRGRPSVLLDDVEIHGAAAHGLGFVSGHAAVAVALAVVAFPYLGRRGRWLAAGLAAFVAVARVYVGAHLPLDVVGGAALGLLAGAAARLVFGRPRPCS